MSSVSRKPIKRSLDSELVSQARELDIRLSRAAEDGIARAVKAERERRWLEENAEAIRAHNEYVEKHGLLLEEYRQF
jgi:antitoxin CcdA